MSPGWVPGPRSPRFSVLAERRFKGGIATGATFQPIASGVKDSCGNIAQSLDLLRRRPEGFAVLTGEDAYFYTLLAHGADGGILASAHVETRDFPSAYAIAEFMLNLLPIPDPPARHALEDYVRARFERPDGSFRFSCDQDFVQIWRRG